MSFFDDASLAFLPSGAAGKDGKAYSIKPTDGTGDFTFSRGSNLAATRIGADGLIEKGRENLLLQSNQFDTTWGLEATTLTSGQTGYDGSSDAWKVIPITDNSTHYVYKTTPYQTGVSTFSVYAKYSGYHAQLRVFNIGGGKAYANFDLQNGTKGTSGGTDIIDSTITSVGNGWYRITLSLNYTIAPYSSGVIPIESPTDGEIPSYAGDGTSGVLIQDFQHEVGLAATDYIESGATTGKAGLLEDEPRFDYSGGATCPSLLLEGSRTNLITQSEYIASWQAIGSITLTSNYGTSPEGVQNSTRVQFSGASQEMRTPATSATGYTPSIYIKGTNNETIKFGSSGVEQLFTLNGDWQRIDLYNAGAPTNVTLNTYSGATARDIEVWGAQCEAGTYPTSYIPNHSGGSVTRGADDYSKTFTTGLSTNSGTMYFEVNLPQGREGTPNMIQLNGASRVGWKGVVTSNPIIQLKGDGTISSSTTFGLSRELHKLLFRWTNGLGEIFIDGVKQASTITDSSAPNTFTGISGTGSSYRAFHKQILLFPTSLSDADCITLTTL